MKKTIILILTLSLILGVFSSCGHKTVDPIDNQTSSSPSEDTSAESTTEELNDINQSENTESDERLPDIDGTTEPNIVKYVTGYELKKVGDQWYMVFDSYIANPADQTYWPPEIAFSSLGSLRSDILNHRLTIADMNTIVSSFTRDEIGVPIFDLDNIYTTNDRGDTVVDYNTFSSTNYWIDGESYSIRHYKDLDDDDGVIYEHEEDYDIVTTFYMLTKETFAEEYNIWAQSQEPRIIQSESKTVKIFTDTDCLYMFITEGEHYYYYYIQILTDPAEIPDDETLLSYGIEKYQE